jgi:hypothetical protein
MPLITFCAEDLEIVPDFPVRLGGGCCSRSLGGVMTELWKNESRRGTTCRSEDRITAREEYLRQDMRLLTHRNVQPARSFVIRRPYIANEDPLI